MNIFLLILFWPELLVEDRPAENAAHDGVIKIGALIAAIFRAAALALFVCGSAFVSLTVLFGILALIAVLYLLAGIIIMSALDAASDTDEEQAYA